MTRFVYGGRIGKAAKGELGKIQLLEPQREQIEHALKEQIAPFIL